MEEIGLAHIIYYTPVNEDNSPIADYWLIQADTLNNTLQWRDHFKVDNMSKIQKGLIEKQVEKHFPNFKWFSSYKACVDYKQGKPEYCSSNIWATSKEEAKEVFKAMDISFLNIEKE